MKVQSDKIREIGLQVLKLTSGEEVIGDCFICDEEKYKGLIFCRVPLRIVEKISNGGIDNIYLLPFTNQQANFDFNDNLSINYNSIMTCGIPHETAIRAWNQHKSSLDKSVHAKNQINEKVIEGELC